VKPEEKITGDGTKELIVFKLGAEEFGADIMQIREISKLMDITRVPGAPSFIDGVINLRGKITPIINLRKKLGFKPKEPGPDTRIIIAELDGHPVGMIVDEVTDVMKIPTKKIVPAPELVTSETSRRYLKGVGKVGKKRLIILLDLEKVLSNEEFIDTGKVEEKAAMSSEIRRGTPKETTKPAEGEPGF